MCFSWGGMFCFPLDKQPRGVEGKGGRGATAAAAGGAVEEPIDDDVRDGQRGARALSPTPADHMEPGADAGVLWEAPRTRAQ